MTNANSSHNNNNNHNAITSTSSASQQLPQNAFQQFGRVDPSVATAPNQGEAAEVPGLAPKRELNIRSWFSSSSVTASNSSPPSAPSATGDLLDLEGSSRDPPPPPQQRPTSPLSGLTPPAPSNEFFYYFMVIHFGESPWTVFVASPESHSLEGPGKCTYCKLYDP